MTIIASGSLVSLSGILESTWGVTPNTPFTGIRKAGITLKPNASFIDSKELRSDRQTADTRMTAVEADGDIDAELIVGAYDDFLEAAMLSSWVSNKLHVGTTLKSLSLEEGFTDIGVFNHISGAVVDSFSISAKPKEIATVKFSFKGKNYTSDNVSQAGVIVDPVDNSPCDTFTGTIKEGGVVSSIITSLDFTVTNGFEMAYVIGEKPVHALAPGRATVTGKVSVLVTDKTLMNKFLNETPSSLEIEFVDKGGVFKYIFRFPRVIYTGFDLPVSKEGLLTLDMPWKAVLDPVSGQTIEIERVLV